MKKIVLSLLPLLLCGAACTHPKETATAPATPADSIAAAGTLIVYYDSSVGAKPLLEAAKSYGATVKYDYGTLNAVALTVPGTHTLNEAREHFGKVEGVLQVTLERTMHLH